jgi:predicted Ser/Thr protein kinase
MREFATGALLKGRYRLQRMLGRGGMAAVWLGHDDVLDRLVAIKVLSDTIASDPDFVARFRREATVAAGLFHPNLVDIYDYSESSERPYLVMEFIPGRDLGSLIAGDGRIDRDKLARELLGAVAHIHAAGIVHRDIKPHNILLEEDRTAKLIDFGIALPPDATALTQTGLILATRRYAAPEVLAGRPASVRSDLYSCGVVLEACGVDGSPALRSLVGSLTAKDPGRRPRTAREALARLEVEDDRGEVTEPYAPTFERPAPVGRPPVERPAREAATRVYSRRGSNRQRWGAAGAILGVAAAVAVAVVLAFGSGSGGGSGPSGRSSQASPSTGAGTKKARSGQTEAQAAKETGAPAAANATAGEGESDEAAAVSESPTVAVPSPEGGDPALGSALNQEGFELIQAGSPEAAVPILERAVRSFPAGTEEVEYAYALFNLGDALLRSGRPEAAIPVLEQRLQIPDQTETVEHELQTAREEVE